MSEDQVKFRLLRSDDLPATNPLGLAYRFGLQDTKQDVVPAERLPDGRLAFDFTLSVKRSRTGASPVFTGRFASGPVDDRFVYLSWRAVEGGAWINRVKARLSDITWELIKQAREQDQRITADTTGWKPGGARKYVTWYLS